MKKLLFKIIIFLLVIVGISFIYIFHDIIGKLDNKVSTYVPEETPIGAQHIINAYPEFNIQYFNNKLIFENGEEVVYDDKLEKDFEDKLNNCDPEDMFSMVYNKNIPPKKFADGGRSRSDELFSIMYGKDKDEVNNNLISIEWFGQNIDFTTVNKANVQLMFVRDDIIKNHPDLIEYLHKSSTFNYRKVKGTKRLSPHGYGIAIDINIDHSDYWLYGNPNAKETDEIGYVNRIPIELVDVFEKYGFIWGGYWYHYDTMHFEYRPEIISYYKSYNK